MKCDEIRQLISCMLDNELSAEDSAKVTDHLADCPECMRVFEAFHAISLSLDQMEEVPGNFTADVMQKVHHAAQRKTKQNKKPTHLRFVRTAAMAACVALVVLAGSQFVSSPLYAGGRPEVANFIRTAEDGKFTPTPAPTMEVIPGDESIGEDPNAGLMTMGLDEDTEAPNSAEAAVPGPEASADPATTPAPVVTPTPVPAVTPTPVPSPVLTMLSDLLVAVEPAQSGKFTTPPALELTVKSADDKVHQLALWADGNRLYCENRTTDAAYYTIGTPAELSQLTGLPVPTPEVSPVP